MTGAAGRPGFRLWHAVAIWSAVTAGLYSGCIDARQNNPLESNPSRALGVGRVEIVRPNGEEYWFVGDSYDIVWASNTVDTSVSLTLSVDGGYTYPHVIATDIPNTGSFAWEVPDLPSERCLVQIVGTSAGDSFQDDSDRDFTILRKPIPVQRTAQGGEWPSWRGDRLAFMSRRTGNYEVWVLHLSNGQLDQITTDSGFDGHPTIDKKSLHLAFTSNRTGRNEIWVSTFFLDGGRTQIQMTTEGGEQPYWRPFPNQNSHRLTFLAPQSGGLSYVATVKITTPMGPSSTAFDIQGLSELGMHRKPIWSIRAFDGADLIYYKTEGGESKSSDMVTVRADLSFDRPKAFRLPFSSPVKNPTVSPSGSRLAVSMDGDIWMVRMVEGNIVGEPLQLTFDPAEDEMPDWQSESDLAFQSDRTGQWEIWTLTIP